MDMLMNSTVKFRVYGKKVKFNINHNLSNNKLEAAVVNWVHRTEDFTAESLSEYINSKKTSDYCEPEKKKHGK